MDNTLRFFWFDQTGDLLYVGELSDAMGVSFRSGYAHDLRGLLLQGYVEITWRAARALGLPY